MEVKNFATVVFLLTLSYFSATDGQISSWSLDSGSAVNGADNDFTSAISKAETADTSTALFTVTAVATNTLESYTIESPTGKFVIGGTSGAGAGEVKLASGQVLDFETETSITIKIAAVDNNSGTRQTGTATVTITVTDATETAAVFSISTAMITLDPPTAANKPIFTLDATDAESDTLTYTIISGNTNADFEIGSSSGIITTANALSTSTSSYTLVVGCEDESVPVQTTTGTISVKLCDDLMCSSSTRSGSISIGTLAVAVFVSLCKLI